MLLNNKFYELLTALFLTKKAKITQEAATLAILSTVMLLLLKYDFSNDIIVVTSLILSVPLTDYVSSGIVSMCSSFHQLSWNEHYNLCGNFRGLYSSTTHETRFHLTYLNFVYQIVGNNSNLH